MASEFIQEIDLRTLRKDLALSVIVVEHLLGACPLRYESVAIALG